MENRLRGHVFHSQKGVLPHIAEMENAVLLTAFHGRKLGKNRKNRLRMAAQNIRTAIGAQKAGHLLGNAFAADFQQVFVAFFQGPGRLRLNGEAEPGGKTQRPQPAHFSR